jgi:hypothetical protein
MNPRSVATLLALLLSGCSPGLVLNLYNATEDALTVTNPGFHRAVTIQPHTAADIHIGNDVLVRNSHHNWLYSQTSALPPTSRFEQHTMLWRAFGRIDSRGRIYLLAPPHGEEGPREITQPAGFPLEPRSGSNKTLQPTAQTASFLPCSS